MPNTFGARARALLTGSTPRLVRERDDARRELAQLRQVAKRRRARIRALAELLAGSQATSARLSDELALTHRTLEHYMQLVSEHDERLADGRAALFDYPYHPAPRRFDLPGRDFFGHLVAGGDDDYVRLLTELGSHLQPLATVPLHERDAGEAYWTNPWLPPLDAVVLYGLVAHLRPATYLEVGSGFSTKFVRRAISDHGLATTIVSIDPHPRADVDELCDEVVRQPYERVDPAFVERLGPGDLMFVDNSHRSFTGSDVTVFFTETLPYLPAGLVYGVHDIFIPEDYPPEWNDRFYAEQYLLMCYLLGGAAGDSILLPVHHVARHPHLHQALAPAWPLPAPMDPSLLLGGGFWMRKGG